jgi:hypothetical protein
MEKGNVTVHLFYPSVTYYYTNRQLLAGKIFDFCNIYERVILIFLLKLFYRNLS